jgi:hypothetical protein
VPGFGRAFVLIPDLLAVNGDGGRERRKMKSKLGRKNQQPASRYLFLEEADHGTDSRKKVFKIFDLENETLFVFSCDKKFKRDEFRSDRSLAKRRDPAFFDGCELVAQKMETVTPILHGRPALVLFSHFVRSSTR